MELKMVGTLVCLALAFAVGCMWVLGLGQAPVSLLPTVAGAGEGTCSLAAEFPEVQGSYTLYQVVLVTVTEERVREIAERFGLSGEPKAVSKVTGEFLLVDAPKEPEEQVSVYAHSRGVAYHILDKALPTEVTEQPDLPSDAEAEKIALALLEKTGDCPPSRALRDSVEEPYVEYISLPMRENGEVCSPSHIFEMFVAGIQGGSRQRSMPWSPSASSSSPCRSCFAGSASPCGGSLSMRSFSPPLSSSGSFDRPSPGGASRCGSMPGLS